MTARPRAVAAAALVLAGGLTAAPAAAAVAPAAPGGSVAASSALSDVSSAALTKAPAGLLRSDPENGSWARRTPDAVRLWFTSGTVARAAAVRVSTPRRTSATDVRLSVSGAVLSVRLPDDGPGDYRVVWYVLPGADGAGAGTDTGADTGYGAADGEGGAAGTVAFRVGGVRPAPGSDRDPDDAPVPGTPRAGGFTIPDRPATSGGRDDATTTPTTTTSTTTTSAAATDARPTTARAGLPALPALPALPPGPAVTPGDGPAVTAALLLTDPVGLGVTGLAGLLACALAARWSWRRGTAAGLRPR